MAHFDVTWHDVTPGAKCSPSARWFLPFCLIPHSHDSRICRNSISYNIILHYDSTLSGTTRITDKFSALVKASMPPFIRQVSTSTCSHISFFLLPFHIALDTNFPASPLILPPNPNSIADQILDYRSFLIKLSVIIILPIPSEFSQFILLSPGSSETSVALA